MHAYDSPVYSLYFTNELGLELKSETIIDASTDEEAYKAAEAIVKACGVTATLWADMVMIRQFSVPTRRDCENAIMRRSRSLDTPLRQTRKPAD